MTRLAVGRVLRGDAKVYHVLVDGPSGQEVRQFAPRGKRRSVRVSRRACRA